jgi:hypothetical protein
MRRLPAALGAALLVPVLLAGCGGDDAGDGEATDRSGSDPTSETTTEPTEPDTEPGETDRPTKSPPITPPGLDYELVALEHATAAGGATEPVATPVGPGEGEGTGRFLGQLTDDSFRELVEQRIVFSRAAGDLYAAVVAVGCDVPTDVVVAEVPDGYTITAQAIGKQTPECFAPVTTVAVVAVQE